MVRVGDRFIRPDRNQNHFYTVQEILDDNLCYLNRQRVTETTPHLTRLLWEISSLEAPNQFTLVGGPSFDGMNVGNNEEVEIQF